MIDRLEILSNGFLHQDFAGSIKRLNAIRSTWDKYQLDRLFDETDFNFIYKKEGFLFKEVYKLSLGNDCNLLLMMGKNFRKMPELKIVINPNHFPFNLLNDFSRKYLMDFYPARIGRIDFNIDFNFPIYELINGFVCQGKRLAVMVREYNKKEIETIYIGAGDLVIRIYNKIKEFYDKGQKDRVLKTYLKKHDPENITRLEFQMRGKKAGLNFQDLAAGRSLKILKDQDFEIYKQKKNDGTMRFLYYESFILNHGFQAFYQKLDRKKRRYILEKDFEKLEIKHFIYEILEKEIYRWVQGDFQYQVYKVNFPGPAAGS